MSYDALLEEVLSCSTGGQVDWNQRYEQARAEKLEAIRQLQAFSSELRRHLNSSSSMWERDDAVMRELRALREEIQELKRRLP